MVRLSHALVGFWLMGMGRATLHFVTEYHESKKEAIREAHSTGSQCRSHATTGDGQGDRAAQATRRIKGTQCLMREKKITHTGGGDRLEAWQS